MGYRDFDRPRTMTKATCSDCGQECEVPFKPTEGRPVYCRECYQKHRPPRESRRYQYLVSQKSQRQFRIISFLSDTFNPLFFQFYNLSGLYLGYLARTDFSTMIEHLIQVYHRFFWLAMEHFNITLEERHTNPLKNMFLSQIV